MIRAYSKGIPSWIHRILTSSDIASGVVDSQYFVNVESLISNYDVVPLFCRELITVARVHGMLQPSKQMFMKLGSEILSP
ncbi:unnamed protein product [Mycena citricolor]|uniref:Uncharacterized protein n=1 Tax=Mycena citricolor TaxID=2018698 RepID=A0AAD2Q5P0_9AGAR|nr:unnamed protein product [Mycena citricolor]